MLRWRIAILVGAAIAISYLDRQTLPVAIKAISRDIPLTNVQFSNLQSAFLLAYAFMYAGGGKLTDALGTRRGFTVIMIFWSLACASHGLALTFTMLAISRFALGMGEGGGFPASTRAVAEWFSVNERATAMGIINGGTAVGAVVAPPLIALILLYANWRWIFLFTGAMGLLWTAWWRASYFPPAEHPQLTEQERAKIPLPADPAVTAVTKDIAWLDLLRFKETWGVVTAKFLSDAAWYFYLFWLPKYLYDARNFDIKAVGAVAWIPNAAAGIGCLVGGWFSSYLVRKNFSVNVARKVALGLSAAVMPLILLVARAPVAWALAIFSLAYFGQQSWSTLVMVLPTDLFPSSVVGAVAGMVGFGGAIGGIAFGELAGYLLDHGFGYSTVFQLAATFHVIAFLVILIAVPKVAPLNMMRNLATETQS
ncbi:MAG TPA: MFS transporter [Candidatus Acidoferrales bacterium]|nr:MFS transporter [Candidatus Acidoferrales bacterium]